MTTENTLRNLARLVRHSHSALSKAVHDGVLTDGVRIEGGRVVVTDIRAAAAQWRDVHIPRVDRMARLEKPKRPRVVPTAGAASGRALETVELYDEAMDRRVTAAELFAERDALALLVGALTAGAGPGIEKRIGAALRAVAEVYGADDQVIEQAKAELRLALCTLADEGAT